VPTSTARRSPEPVHLALMLALTFSTGVVDAIGYLGLDRVFTGNMTGNVVILGMGLVGGNGLPVLGPLLALVGFLAGAAAVGRTLRRVTEPWSAATTGVLAVVGVVVLVLAGVLLGAPDEPGKALEITCTTLLGLVMGMQAAAARVVAVKDITTVVVTSTLTGLAADSVLGAGTAKGASRRRAAAVVLLIGGAAAGAGLLKIHDGAGLLLAGVVILAVAGVGALRGRSA
jgi:uncharacterized membrane protein YoaK (UPF0700 family)